MAWRWPKRCGMPPEPPSNGGYLVAAYIVTTAILLGYWLRLWLKSKKA